MPDRQPLLAKNSTLLGIFAFLLPITAQNSANERKNIENGLTTGYQISGSEPQHMNILDRMKFHHVPGTSVAVIRGGKVAWLGAYGVQQTDGAAVDTLTVFNAASISKAVTALAVLSLAQTGKIDLDRDVNSYLKRWKIPSNEWSPRATVTTRMLLNHTAGFGTSTGQVYKPSTVPTLLEQLNGLPPATNPPVHVRMLPGSKFEYSNNGYLVLELLIEEVTGKPFAQAMDDLVLGPLGMTRSTFEMPLPKKFAMNAASAFGGGQTTGMPADEFVIPNLAAGGLWTNADDLRRSRLRFRPHPPEAMPKFLARGVPG